MDPVQLTIIIISFCLTILICVLGIQVYLILKEIRLSLMKVNKMLDDAGVVSGTVSASVTEVSGFMGGIRSGIKLISQMSKKGDHHD